jgi:multimeric flavodoxin WrbA
VKILTIFGSPRKKANTATVLEIIEKELEARGHAVERLDVNEQKVKGCMACYKCQGTTDAPGCAQQDDALKIFKKMLAADALIYASPVYCWGWTAQIKPLIDRHFCLVKAFGTENWKSLLDSKRSGLVMCAGGGIEDNAELAVRQYDKLSHYTKTDVKVRLIIPFCSTPDKFGELVTQKAVEFAEELVS